MGHPRGSKCGFCLLVAIGCAFCIGAIYRLVSPSDSSDTSPSTMLVVLGGGILWILFAFCLRGSSEIVFDDNTQSIYERRKRFCSNCSSTKTVGQYATFQQCAVKERWESSDGGVGRSRIYNLEFKFNDGTTYDGGKDHFHETEMNQIAHEINEWWKTTPHYRSTHPVPTAPVQVVVQQPPNQVMMPVVGGRGPVTYVQYVQQPVSGQPVYQHTAPHGQGQMVYGQQ